MTVETRTKPQVAIMNAVHDLPVSRPNWSSWTFATRASDQATSSLSPCSPSTYAWMLRGSMA